MAKLQKSKTGEYRCVEHVGICQLTSLCDITNWRWFYTRFICSAPHGTAQLISGRVGLAARQSGHFSLGYWIPSMLMDRICSRSTAVPGEADIGSRKASYSGDIQSFRLTVQYISKQQFQCMAINELHQQSFYDWFWASGCFNYASFVEHR